MDLVFVHISILILIALIHVGSAVCPLMNTQGLNKEIANVALIAHLSGAITGNDVDNFYFNINELSINCLFYL